MATDLTLARHLDGLRAAMVAFVRYADRAGLRAGVPTTPDWDVRRLVAHQGMVHRWATALVRGELPDPDGDERAGRTDPDPLEWLRDGAVDLALALTRAPDDLDTPVFLADAPPPRRFWARRQCHETTMHAVDALAAALGRRPRAVETWISDDLALDGLDELLTGFLPRPTTRLRCDDPLVLAVRPEGSATGWQVEVGPGAPVTTRVVEPAGDVVLAGSPVALYLTLWNRSDEVSPADSALDWDLAAISWR